MGDVKQTAQEASDRGGSIADGAPTYITFRLGDVEAMRIEADGTFTANGETLKGAREVYDTFCAWMAKADTPTPHPLDVAVLELSKLAAAGYVTMRVWDDGHAEIRWYGPKDENVVEGDVSGAGGSVLPSVALAALRVRP